MVLHRRVIPRGRHATCGPLLSLARHCDLVASFPSGIPETGWMGRLDPIDSSRQPEWDIHALSVTKDAGTFCVNRASPLCTFPSSRGSARG